MPSYACRHRQSIALITALVLCCCAAMLTPDFAHALVRTMTINQTSDGQDMTFNFSGLIPATSDVEVTVTVYGDYDLSTEFAEVWIDSVKKPNHDGGPPQCNQSGSEIQYVLPASNVSDGELVVRVDLSPNVGSETCSPDLTERVVVKVSYTQLKPDLTLNSSSIPFTGTTAGAGSTFSARYGIRNVGAGFTTDFYTYFYYCPNSSGVGCTPIGSQQITRNFNTDETYYLDSPTLTMPPNVEYGTRYVRILVDALNAIVEESESNNARFDSISVTTRPDMFLGSATVPATGNLNGYGSTFTGSYVVHNLSNSSRVGSDFVVNYQYCRTVSDTDCSFLGANTLTGGLNSGAQINASTITLTLPNSVRHGTGYLRFFIDSNNAVAELSEANNSYYKTITISGYPDLEVSALAVTPEELVPGGTAEVSYQVRNSGLASTGSGFSLRLYYSEDATISPTDSVLYTRVFPELAAGGAANEDANVVIPASAPLGVGYIGAIVDFDNTIDEGPAELNNSRASAVNIVEPAPDLALQSFNSTSTVTGYGSITEISYVLTNSGTENATSFDIHFYYSDDASTSGTFFTYLGKQHFAGLVAGSSHNGMLSLPVPDVVLKGTRYLHYFIDALGEVDEANENNNRGYKSFVVSGGPDLTVQSLALTPTSQSAGGEMNLSYTLRNSGTTRVANPAMDAVYYSYNSTITVDDERLATRPVVQLKAGETSATQELTVTLPQSAAVGTRYMGVYTDYTNQIAETVELNNSRAAVFTCNLPSYDLNVTRIGGGSGTVTSGDGGIDCGAVCASAYPSGASVTLSRLSDEFSYFKGWGGDCSGVAGCTLVMSEAKTVTASFGLKGDFNEDDSLDLRDLILVLKVLSGEADYVNIDADADGDSFVTLADAIYILSRLSSGG